MYVGRFYGKLNIENTILDSIFFFMFLYHMFVIIFPNLSGRLASHMANTRFPIYRYQNSYRVDYMF